ncbi:pescadillo-related [Zea mays]|uniref:Auxin-responsive protein n=1 Tax=Zea mays TaxID=4577 RepID=A0A1D6L0F8_MAIZE|nr:pescadillo-related [Zea mays]
MPKHYRPAGKKKEGNAAKYITRTKAVNYLQVSLAIFRAQVVGWPPVRNYRKNTLAAATASRSKAPTEETASGAGPMYVKVSMDGAPYLRKVDIKMYSSYEDLSLALEKMFSCFIAGQSGLHKSSSKDRLTNGSKVDALKDQEYVLTYEDKDADWMLVGDLPWEVDYLQSWRSSPLGRFFCLPTKRNGGGLTVSHRGSEDRAWRKGTRRWSCYSRRSAWTSTSSRCCHPLRPRARGWWRRRWRTTQASSPPWHRPTWWSRPCPGRTSAATITPCSISSSRLSRRLGTSRVCLVRRGLKKASFLIHFVD